MLFWLMHNIKYLIYLCKWHKLCGYSSLVFCRIWWSLPLFFMTTYQHLKCEPNIIMTNCARQWKKFMKTLHCNVYDIRQSIRVEIRKKEKVYNFIMHHWDFNFQSNIYGRFRQHFTGSWPDGVLAWAAGLVILAPWVTLATHAQLVAGWGLNHPSGPSLFPTLSCNLSKGVEKIIICKEKKYFDDAMANVENVATC